MLPSHLHQPNHGGTGSPAAAATAAVSSGHSLTATVGAPDPSRFPIMPIPQQHQHHNQQQHQFPLGITGVLCHSRLIPVPRGGSLHYTIFRPRNLQYNPPLICIAGGPLLPCQYLTPLVHLVTDRSIVLYDHVGCGQSTAVSSASINNRLNQQNSSMSDGNDVNLDLNGVMSTDEERMIDEMVDDLTLLIEELSPPGFSLSSSSPSTSTTTTPLASGGNSCEEFHLFGHSFGGIIAYEYLKREEAEQRKMKNEDNMKTGSESKEDKNGREVSSSDAGGKRKKRARCRTVILASSPFSIPDVLKACDTIKEEIVKELAVAEQEPLRKKPATRQDSNDSNDDIDAVKEMATRVNELFRIRYECNVTPLPLPLHQSYQQAVFFSSAGTAAAAGLKAVRHYSALNRRPERSVKTRALIIRGQNDFISMSDCQGWAKLLPNCNVMTLAGCSHYGMLEQESMYGSVIAAFLHDHDPPPKPLVLPLPPPPSSPTKPMKPQRTDAV